MYSLVWYIKLIHIIIACYPALNTGPAQHQSDPFLFFWHDGVGSITGGRLSRGGVLNQHNKNWQPFDRLQVLHTGPSPTPLSHSHTDVWLIYAPAKDDDDDDNT